MRGIRIRLTLLTILLLACAGTKAATATMVDVVFLIDDGGSMASEFSTVLAGLPTFDGELSASHDVQYALITFNATPTLQTPSLTSFNSINSILADTQLTGIGQNGSLAASLAATVPFRTGSERFAILFSDGPNDGSSQVNDAAADMLGVDLSFLAVTPSLPPEPSYADLAFLTGSVDANGSPLIFPELGQASLDYRNIAAAVDTIATVPEPSTLLFLGLGFIGLAAKTDARRMSRDAIGIE